MTPSVPAVGESTDVVLPPLSVTPLSVTLISGDTSETPVDDSAAVATRMGSRSGNTRGRSARASRRLIEKRLRHPERTVTVAPTTVKRNGWASAFALTVVAAFVAVFAIPQIAVQEVALAEGGLTIDSAAAAATVQGYTVADAGAIELKRDDIKVRNTVPTSISFGSYYVDLNAAVRWPLPFVAQISDGYRCRSMSGGTCTRFHAGLDFLGPYGSPITSIAAGKVTAVGWFAGFGNRVEVYHADLGVKTLYAHMSSTSVSVGQSVAPGQLLGKMGSTGISTANHLHFEVHSGGSPVDPYAWLKKHASG